jgi:hypothetical protein
MLAAPVLVIPAPARIAKFPAVPSEIVEAAVVVPRNPKRENIKVTMTAVTKNRVFAEKV